MCSNFAFWRLSHAWSKVETCHLELTALREIKRSHTILRLHTHASDVSHNLETEPYGRFVLKGAHRIPKSPFGKAICYSEITFVPLLTHKASFCLHQSSADLSLLTLFSLSFSPSTFHHAPTLHFSHRYFHLLMWGHTSDPTTPDLSLTRRGHRLSKRDARIQCVMLGSYSSKCWHGVLAEHLERYNHYLQDGRAMGKLFHAWGGCYE